MKHIMIIKNNKEHLRFAKQIKTILEENHIFLYCSSSLEDSKKILDQLSEPTRVYLAGGDGTVNQLLSYFVHTNHELAIIPLGTGNDLNRTIGISKKAIEVFKAATHKESHLVDVIQINDTYSINVACFGIDSTIANHLHDETTLPIPKKLGYIVGILKYIFRYHGYDFTLLVDEKIIYQNKITIAALANANYYGGGFCIYPKANLMDGKLNIRVVDYLPLLRVPYLFLLLLFKKLGHQKEVHDYQFNACTITCSNPCNKDGEEYLASSYHIQLLPQSIRIIFTKELHF